MLKLSVQLFVSGNNINALFWTSVHRFFIAKTYTKHLNLYRQYLICHRYNKTNIMYLCLTYYVNKTTERNVCMIITAECVWLLYFERNYINIRFYVMHSTLSIVVINLLKKSVLTLLFLKQIKLFSYTEWNFL